MNIETLNLFWPYCVFIILLIIAGLYCILATFNLIRAVIGLEIMIKAVTLLIIVLGNINGCSAFAQAFVITLIVIEVVLMVVVGGVILWLFRYNETIDTRKLTNLRG